MKKMMTLVLALVCVLSLFGCSQKEPYVVNTYYSVSDTEATPEDDEFIIFIKHLEITGRMPNAAKDSTFVFLSNIEDISFDKAWKASGFSSNMNDYFAKETAKFVGMK